MSILPEFQPVLADGDAVAFAVIALITIVGWIVRLVNAEKSKAPPVGSRPRPPARPRDTRVAQEINIFVEDNTKTRNKPARPGSPPARPQPVSKQAGRRQQPQPAPAPGAAKRKGRPGEELSKRPAPVAENLGGGVSQHLRQHMTERVSKEAEQRLVPRVEEKVTADLGSPIALGVQPQGGGAAGRPAAKSTAAKFAELLRTPAGMQQAVVMNLILSPPPGRTRTQRR